MVNAASEIFMLNAENWAEDYILDGLRKFLKEADIYCLTSGEKSEVLNLYIKKSKDIESILEKEGVKL